MGRGNAEASGYLTKVIHHKLHYLMQDGNLAELIDNYTNALIVTRDKYKAQYKRLGYNFSRIQDYE